MSRPAGGQSLVRGLRARLPREHAARGVEERAAAGPLDERDLRTALVAEGGRGHGAHVRERQLDAQDPERRSGVVAHQHRAGDDEPSRVRRAIGLGDVYLSAPRAERRAEERVVADVACERLRRRRPALHHTRPLASVEADCRRGPDDSGVGPLEGAERAVDVGAAHRRGRGKPVAECAVAGEQAEREPGARKDPAHGIGLAVCLQREALVEAGARPRPLGDRQRDAGDGEQQARYQCGESGVAHANEGAGPPRTTIDTAPGCAHPAKGEA